MTPAEACYETHRARVGSPLPWAKLSAAQQAHWDAVALAGIRVYLRWMYLARGVQIQDAEEGRTSPTAMGYTPHP